MLTLHRPHNQIKTDDKFDSNVVTLRQTKVYNLERFKHIQSTEFNYLFKFLA